MVLGSFLILFPLEAGENLVRMKELHLSQPPSITKAGFKYERL